MTTIADTIQTLQKQLYKNQIVVTIIAFTNKYIFRVLSKTEFTSHLIASSSSRLVTAFLIYLGILLAVYETILHSGVALGLWKNPADEVFKEIPVHCAHVYVSINLVKKNEEETDDKGKPKFLLKYPIVYHFEFSPEEYAHEEYGTDLKFIKSKVHDWFSTSEVYHHHKKEIKEPVTVDDLTFFSKKGKELQGDDEYLCDLDVGTGDTIFCVIEY
jgi:hypothetical protein